MEVIGGIEKALWFENTHKWEEVWIIELITEYTTNP